MKREVMESANLDLYAQIGLVIFFVVFVLIIARVVLMNKNEADEIGHIPLDGDLSPDSLGEITNSLREHDNDKEVSP